MKTLMVGFDAFDPQLFEKLHEEGKMPNLSKYVEIGGTRGYECQIHRKAKFPGQVLQQV